MAAPVRQAAGQPKQPEPLPGVVPGDEVFVRHAKGPVSGKVLSHGQHGATIDIGGKQHKVPWQHVLAHKRRVAQTYHVEDEGEDGMIVRDNAGGRHFIGIPPEAREEQMMVKSLDGGVRQVFLVKADAPYMGAPGLVKKQITDKRGVQTTRWVSTKPDDPKAMPGHHVGFTNGDHAGHGKVIASGRDGVTVQDPAGGIHRVPHETVSHKWEGGGRPEGSPHAADPEKPDYAPREDGEADKAYAKRAVDTGPEVGKLPQAHDRYFNTAGAKNIPLDKLHSTKTEEANQKGGDNGPKRMLAAYHGALGKRDPIKVMPHGEKQGHYEVVDGNGTLTSAQKLGWSDLPVQEVSREEGLAHMADEAAKDAAKKVINPEKFADKPEKARQAFTTKEELYAAAPEALEHLKAWLDQGKGIASKLGMKTMTKSPTAVTPEEWKAHKGMLFIAGLKDADGRAKEKVEGSYGGDWGKLLDVVRCTLAVDNLHDMADVFKAMEAGGMEIMQKPKDKFSKPTPQGYRDFNVIVKMPNGVAAEVQLNVKDMLKAKNEGHHHYEITRKIAEKYEGLGVVGDQTKWDPAEAKAYNEADKAQTSIYDGAWLEHIKTHYGSSSNMAKSLRQVMMFFGRKK